ncbi:signal transduction histidine kinase [Sphingomonas vulcanisoli]|uniref:histidine kinase n=1 Tax=Sphingomonas vulcanisoli TaxID=1658060 RepID=A0ABX0TTH9_9SPHN|nr:ATP-binding protein [Sphingomonas vulcanisoli]NIJ07075.1 signal transduction histidine kinase [Sphingomonas vulcanisoli]
MLDTSPESSAASPDAPARATTLSQRNFGYKVLALVALGFLAVLAAGISAGLLVGRVQTDTGWVEHTFQVQQQVQSLALDLQNLRTSRALNRLRHQNALNSPEAADYANTYRNIHTKLDSLARLTRDNPRQAERLAAFHIWLQRYVAVSAPGTFIGPADPVPQVNNHLFEQLQVLTVGLFGEEQHLLSLRIANERASIAIFWKVLTAAGILLVIVAIGSVTVIRRYTVDLAGSRDELQKLNAGLEDMVRDRTADLQRANDEIQRFAYIVSHDLRSPLVNVLGFTSELSSALKPLDALIERAEAEAPQIVEESARLAVREDLPEAIGFIRTSTQKMDRLINAILRLSREGSRTVAPERIDMNALVDGVIGAIKHRIDEEGITVRVASNLPPIISDRLAIEQVFSNLVENAVKYLKKGRPGEIDIRGRALGAQIIYEIQDNGRGIDPRDHARVFDLFRRSGVQDQPGEGIGLANVRALVYRLGGLIDVRSALDQGATFILTLPAVFTGEKEQAK